MTTKRRLGLGAGIAFAAGAMFGPGFFVLPGSVYAAAGPALVLSYALAALLILPAVLSKCELVSAIPRTGGSYVYVARGLGPLAATVTGGVDWLATVLKVAFALEGVGSLAMLFLPWEAEWVVRLVAVLACVAIYLHFALGAQLTGMVQIGLVGLVGLAVLSYEASALPALELERLVTAPASWEIVVAEAGLVCVAFGGLTSLVKIAGEFEAPERVVPRAMLIAFAGCATVYVLGIFVTFGVSETATLSTDKLPLAAGAEAVLGSAGRHLIEVAALLAFLTAATTGIFAASRTLWAMARDGLAPAFLGREPDARVGPLAATTATTLAVASVCALLSIESVIKAASAMLLLQLITVELSILVLARSPSFRPTFHVGGWPWLPLLATVCYGGLLFGLGTGPILQTLAVVAVSVVWYLVYVARRVQRESALIELVRGLAGRELKGGEGELASLAIPHVQEPADPVEAALAAAPLLDLAEELTSAQLFARLGGLLAGRVGLPADDLAKILREREEASSTVIAPGLAIPHAVVPGSGVFVIALVRSVPGVHFPAPPHLDGPATATVYAAFAILCSEDSRHLHLKALMRLAQSSNRPDFAERWREAEDGALRGLLA